MIAFLVTTLYKKQSNMTILGMCGVCVRSFVGPSRTTTSAADNDDTTVFEHKTFHGLIEFHINQHSNDRFSS
jgi:hypothetical protein